jgi:signal transduction histidine kinase
MSREGSVATAEGRNDLDFAKVLRECLNSAVIVIDENRKVAAINPRAEAILQVEARVVLGKPVEKLPAPLAKLAEAALASGKPTEKQLTLPAGTQRQVLVRASVTPLAGKSGKGSGVAVVLNDVSQAGKWEANFRRLDRLHSVGTLSAGMAHEVRNAFVAVKTFVDLLLEQNKDTELADIVRLEMSRIDTILGQMRKFSAPCQPNLAEVRVNTVLDKSLTLIQHLLEEKKIKVARSLGAANDLLEGDADQLEQAFINLFFNALDSMQPHGRLAVSTEMLPAGAKIAGFRPAKDLAMVRVAIHDTGAGIPPEHMDRLFEPFFTTKADGTGLGLAITHRIIEEHHGAITVQSELHKGTTFNLFLPTIRAGA